MTAFKDLRRHPQHNARTNTRIKNVPPRFNDSTLSGVPFRQTVRNTAKSRSR